MPYRLTPDGGRYLSMAHGNAEPLPFHLRWLLPKVCGAKGRYWFASTAVSIVAIVALTAVLALQHGATLTQAIVAALLMGGLPSLRFYWFSPVLVDAPAIALALAAAVLWPISPLAAVGVCLLGGCVSEKVPVLAAVFSLQPLLLVGLLAPLARRLQASPGEINSQDALAWTLANPWKASRKAHAGQWRNPAVMLLPWGACLVVVLAVPSLWLVLALAVGYGQMLLVTDTTREYQMLAPVVCVTAAMMIPEVWMVPVLLAHWFNPWAGSGL